MKLFDSRDIEKQLSFEESVKCIEQAFLLQEEGGYVMPEFGYFPWFKIEYWFSNSLGGELCNIRLEEEDSS